MTYQDHVRIATRFIDFGTVSNADREIMRAAQPLETPIGGLLNVAVRRKVETLVHEAKVAPTPSSRNLRRVSIAKFAHTPLGRAFIKS